jgi:hypothetical protein
MPTVRDDTGVWLGLLKGELGLWRIDVPSLDLPAIKPREKG